MEGFIDLHLHSVHSDGVYPPAELVEMAAKTGLQAIALADHDTVAGIDEALTAGTQRKIEVVPAIELSVELRGFHDIHLLGYYIRYNDSAFLDKLELFRTRRDQRVRAILEKINRKLAAMGKENVAYEEVSALAAGAIGRPHIAQVLISRRLVRDMQDAFMRYLIPCNVPKVYYPIDQALQEIRRLGGVAVLAHPTTVTQDRTKLRQVVTTLAEMGLEGIEVYNSTCCNDDMMFLEGLANRIGLLKTGGSDFHGVEKEVRIGSGRGGLAVPYALLTELKKKKDEHQ